MNRNTKVNIALALIFIGTIWWFVSGHEIITESNGFEQLLNRYRGGGFFSFGFIVIALAFFSAFLYPPLLWILICFEFVDRGSFIKSLFNRESYYIWGAPLIAIFFICAIFILRTVGSIIANVIFICTIIYFAVVCVKELVKKWKVKN